MDYLAALNPTFREREFEVRTEVGICDQGSSENDQMVTCSFAALLLTRLDSARALQYAFNIA